MYVYAEERNTTYPSMKKDLSQPSVKNDHNKVSKKIVYLECRGARETTSATLSEFFKVKDYL